MAAGWRHRQLRRRAAELRDRATESAAPVWHTNGFPALYPDAGDALGMCEAASRLGGRGWIVIDGYRFDAAYHAALRPAAWPLLVIDDYAHLPYYDADLLLNQNLGAERLRYSGPPAMNRLLGPLLPDRQESRPAPALTPTAPRQRLSDDLRCRPQHVTGFCSSADTDAPPT